MTLFESKSLPTECDVLAPDGSEIRFLPVLRGGSMVHCRLVPGTVTKAVTHKTVEEFWYVTAGQGRLWRSMGEVEEVVELTPGTAHTIPLGAHFQFCADGYQELAMIIVTMPPWPDMDEAVAVHDHWPPTVLV